MTPYPQSSSVKLRLEVEIRGVLSVTEKSATITNKETIFEWVRSPGRPRPGVPDVVLERREVDKVWVLELDDDLKKTAQTLHGKEVVVTGKCLVLGIRSAAETGKIPLAPIPRGGVTSDTPVVVPEGFATSVQSQLHLDDRVTVMSLKAAR
jgi:hypothetical protein